MRRIRHRVLIRLLEGTAVGILALDVVLYLAAVQPLRRALASEEQRLAAALRRLEEAEERAGRLQRHLMALPNAESQVRAFLSDRVAPRRRGFSRAARLVRLLAEASHLQLGEVAYKLDSAREQPLERLEIEVGVTGPFRDLLSFAHAFETAGDFVLVRECVFEPAEQGVLGLRLRADLYLQR